MRKCKFFFFNKKSFNKEQSQHSSYEYTEIIKAILKLYGEGPSLSKVKLQQNVLVI